MSQQPAEDRRWMRHALSLARKGKGFTSPNPCVGAVVVSNKKVIGRGWHRQAGDPHAEVHALREAGESARGATLYVTLEPCAHYGRTLPCTELITNSGLARVVIAIKDPNPLVNGKGLDKLRRNGINIDVGLMGQEATRLIEEFVAFQTQNRPFVTLKIAMSLDGKIATHTGQSQWITGKRARRIAHRLRHEHDAVLVGVNTVLQDDPRLTVRLTGRWTQPQRIVADSNARTPANARVISESTKSKCLIATTRLAPKQKRDALAGAGAEIMIVRRTNGRTNLSHLMQLLAERNITSVLIEGGGELAWSAAHANIIDKMVLFVGPLLLGGRDAPTAINGHGVARLADAFKVTDLSVRHVDEDLLLTGYVAR